MLALETLERRASLVLPDRADVSSARAIHELLIRTQIGMFDSAKIDASGVSKLDCAVLQLLLGWLTVLESQHIPWRWNAVSETFRQIVQLAGLTATLRLTDGVAYETTSD